MLHDIQKVQWNNWRWQMQNRIRTRAQFESGLAMYSPQFQRSKWALQDRVQAIASVQGTFPLVVTPYYLSLIDPDDENCPILKQIIPEGRELNDNHFPDEDPLFEEVDMPIAGLIRKYRDRILWILTRECAAYCRFCMRRRQVAHPEKSGNRFNVRDILTYIRQEVEIKEVILSGGDPLSLDDKEISRILGTLREIDHIVSIRVHSRMPVTLPMRITPELAAIFREFFPITLVSHFNHPREITPESAKAIRSLRMNGVLVLNQTVLLSGINDSFHIQEALVLGLLRIGVKPYYLHQCDNVRGVAHFRTPRWKGLEIINHLRKSNPGIAVPTMVLDLPGGGEKFVLAP